MEKEIKFNELQTRALNVIECSKISLLLSHCRSGKTFVALYKLLNRASTYKSKYAIVSATLNYIEKAIIWEALIRMSDLTGIYYNLNNLPWVAKLPNGSEIYFGGFDYKYDVENVFVNKYDCILIDNAEGVSYGSFLMAKNCLNESNESKIIITTEPFEDERRNHNWIKDIFLYSIDPITQAEIENNGLFGAAYMYSTEVPIDEGFLNMLNTLPEDKKKRFLIGEFNQDTWMSQRGD